MALHSVLNDVTSEEFQHAQLDLFIAQFHLYKTDEEWMSIELHRILVDYPTEKAIKCWHALKASTNSYRALALLDELTEYAQQLLDNAIPTVQDEPERTIAGVIHALYEGYLRCTTNDGYCRSLMKDTPVKRHPGDLLCDAEYIALHGAKGSFLWSLTDTGTYLNALPYKSHKATQDYGISHDAIHFYWNGSYLFLVSADMALKIAQEVR